MIYASVTSDKWIAWVDLYGLSRTTRNSKKAITTKWTIYVHTRIRTYVRQDPQLLKQSQIWILVNKILRMCLKWISINNSDCWQYNFFFHFVVLACFAFLAVNSCLMFIRSNGCIERKMILYDVHEREKSSDFNRRQLLITIITESPFSIIIVHVHHLHQLE